MEQKDRGIMIGFLKESLVPKKAKLSEARKEMKGLETLVCESKKRVFSLTHEVNVVTTAISELENLGVKKMRVKEQSENLSQNDRFEGDDWFKVDRMLLNVKAVRDIVSEFSGKTFTTKDVLPIIDKYHSGLKGRSRNVYATGYIRFLKSRGKIPEEQKYKYTLASSYSEGGDETDWGKVARELREAEMLK